MDIKQGRIQFEIRLEDRDYSGLTIVNRYLENANIERSFFNGANLTNCFFAAVKMNNTEFSEAKIQKSEFSKADFSGSDFVDTLFENTSFVDCSFEKGEWRDATFRQCKFVGCNFDHTTVAVCTFLGCNFDAETLTTMEHRALYYNVFSRCKFGRPTSNSHFSSRNFGIPAAGGQGTMVPADSETTIEQMCLLNNAGHLRAIDVAGVAEAICRSLAGGAHRRTSALIFFSKVVRVLTDERRISPTSLIYLEQIVTHFAGGVDDQDLFTAAMTTVVEIRSALFSVATERSDEDDSTDIARHITISFSETYTERQAEILRETLANVAAASPDSLVTESVRSGSTIIEIISANLISVGALLVAFNFVLRQAKVTIERLGDIKRIANKLRKPKKSAAKQTKRSGRPPSKVPAIMKTGAVLPELISIRAAVSRHGRLLVEMDEKADVQIAVSVSFEEMH
jgi:uncharacterized protein YjbI with pentapeptide repeats